MKIILSILLVLFVFSTQVFAEDVYVTKRGTRYHLSACQVVHDEETSVISLEEAQEKGMRPCEICITNGSDKTKAPLLSTTQQAPAVQSRQLNYLEQTDDFKRR